MDALVDSSFDGPGNRLANHRAHAAADEGVFHHARNDGAAHQLALRIDDRVFQPRILLRLFQARGVRLQVHELERVGRSYVAVEGLILVIVDELG